jgi:hypothetical protein
MRPHDFRTLALALLTLYAPAASAQNLIADPGFETGFVPDCNQANVPGTWYISSVTPDVYSFDCSTLPGLHPASFNNYPTLPAAKDGLRFVAGGHFGSAIEAFGQTLAAPLVAGEQYTLSGWFTLSYQRPEAGVFDIYLSPNTNWGGGTLVGSIGAGMGQDAWSFDMLSFVAPVNAASLPNIIMVPRSLATQPDSYMATDAWNLTQDSATDAESGSWGEVKARFRR